MPAVDRLRPVARLLATIVLAYGLALSGLMGSIASGAHAGEARIAAQLGLICTVHGTVDPSSGQSDRVPGKVSCVEHCTLASGALAKAALPSPVILASLEPIAADFVHTHSSWLPPFASLGLSPPPRGPPAIL
jgi:hypothetical protein